VPSTEGIFFGAYRGFRNLWGFSMYHHVANCRRKAFLKQLFSLFLIFTLYFNSFNSAFAVDSGDIELQRTITLAQNDVSSARRIYATAQVKHDVDDVLGGIKSRTVIKNVIVEDNPSKLRLGRVLLQRAKAVAGGNVAGVVGAAAVIALIEGVGWVMEEGTWVKLKPAQPDDNCSSCTYYWRQQYQGSKKFPTYKTACPATLGPSPNTGGTVYIHRDKPYTINSLNSVTCHYKHRDYPNSTNFYMDVDTYRSQNPNPQPPPAPIKITITDEDVGGIATGDYVDPVDESQNINDKKYKPVVVTAYEHEPSGVGEDIANEIDERIKTAPPTEDGKPAPKGHPKYANPPDPDKKINDRSWEDDSANDAEGDTTPVVDPETGEPTGGQKISITFPVFCTWAHSVCDWYDQWRVSDTVYKDHLEKTKEHQTKEVTFWTKVTDFFDWAQDDDDLDDDEPEQVNEIPLPELNTGTFQASAGCPPPIPVPVNFGTQGEIQISYEPICQMAEKWSFVAPLIGFLSGAMILIGVGRKGEDGEI
jgi:hypothetical protein